VKTKRLFVAIDLPESIKRFLVDLDPQIGGVRWVDVDQMHLTLGFFDSVPEDVDLKLREKLSLIHFGAFFLPIAGVGTFPPKGAPKIIWIGVGRGHPHLFQLHKRVSDAAFAVGLEPDLRPWHPHITLARCQNVPLHLVRGFLKSNADLDAGMMHVESFHLFSSKLGPAGPTHTRELTLSCSGGRSLP
jgi:2'-5' RNA ligase